MTAIGGVMALGVLHPTTLRCEFRTNPLGMDVAAPLIELADHLSAGRLGQGSQLLLRVRPNILVRLDGGEHGTLAIMDFMQNGRS